MSLKRAASILLILITMISVSGCTQEKSTSEGTNKISTSTKLIDSTSSNSTKQDISSGANKNINTSLATDLQKPFKTYVDKKLGFSVDYPLNWNSKIEERIEATKEHNSTPDVGIHIYVDGNQNERIYVFNQVGHISPGFSPEEDVQKDTFTSTSGLTGHIESLIQDGKIHAVLIFDDISNYHGFLGASIYMSTENYKKSEKEILGVLKSIRLSSN